MKKIILMLLVGFSLIACHENDGFEELKVEVESQNNSADVGGTDGNGEGTSGQGEEPPKD